MIALGLHRNPKTGTDPVTRTILTTGQYGRKSFTVLYPQYTHLACTDNHSNVVPAWRTDPRSSTGISTFVAALPFVMREFEVTRTVALLAISMYTVGIVVGPLICSPFSELYGRGIIYWTNLPMLAIFNAIAAASDNFAVLVAFRFLAGAGGSGVLAVGAGTPSVLSQDVLGLCLARYYFRFVGLKGCRSSRVNIYPGSLPWSDSRPTNWRIYHCTARQRLEIRNLGRTHDFGACWSCNGLYAGDFQNPDSVPAREKTRHPSQT